MKNDISSLVLWFSVFSLAFELPFLFFAGQGIKLWIIAAAFCGIILIWDLFKEGFSWIKNSKIILLGTGLILFSLLGALNSPQVGYSLKQVLILAILLTLSVFWEKYLINNIKITYSALATGIIISSIWAIYQNLAFEYGLPNFEIMAARPNGFFPEPDWLGIYLSLGLVPFFVIKREVLLPKFLQNKYFLYLFCLLTTIALIITVARASWLAFLAEIAVILGILIFQTIKKTGYKKSYKFIKRSAVFISLIALSVIFIEIFHLSRFNIPDRFRSIFFGEHIITVAQNPNSGEILKIDLEEIEKYRSQGYLIKENYVADENVTSRGERATSAWDTIKKHPIMGSGLGITLINTNFEHNANNLFLEWWASAGILGLGFIVSFIIYLIVKGIKLLKKDANTAALVLSGTAGFIIVNLFNASIFLAFAWFYLVWLLVQAKEK